LENSFFVGAEGVRMTEDVLKLIAEYVKNEAAWDKLEESLKDALGDDLLVQIVDPIVGFVPEDIVRGITILREQVRRLSAQVSESRQMALAGPFMVKCSNYVPREKRS
jgi:hypothetical protein